MSEDDKLKSLRQKVKDIQKEIKAISGSERMEKDFKKWKTLTDMRDSFQATLNKNEDSKNMSLKALMKLPDYYIYADTKKSKSGSKIKVKATNKDVEWVKVALKKGVSEATLISNADVMRKDEWVKKNTRTKKRKPPTPEGTILFQQEEQDKITFEGEVLPKNEKVKDGEGMSRSDAVNNLGGS